jgi:hypothetical protein
MKPTTIRNAVITAACAVALSVPLIVHAISFIGVTGQYIDGSTNTVVIAGTNATVATVLGATTNFFNLPNVTYNTNNWPAIGIPNYNNLQAWHYAGIQVQTTTNLGDDVTVRMAVSGDNSHWTSNFFVFKVPKGASFANVATNLESYGFPFVAMQAIENPSASNVVGLLIQASPKPGL